MWAKWGCGRLSGHGTTRDGAWGATWADARRLMGRTHGPAAPHAQGPPQDGGESNRGAFTAYDIGPWARLRGDTNTKIQRDAETQRERREEAQRHADLGVSGCIALL